MKLNTYSNFLSFLSLIFTVQSSLICDQDTLNLEIQQDLADNNVLDCLRTIPAPIDKEETVEHTNKRLLA